MFTKLICRLRIRRDNHLFGSHGIFIMPYLESSAAISANIP